ncbi:MAG: HEPN domain-containing protein [Candidatus Tenebribacter burtonii]|jgi:hypothetical protein|nr:HEPN domain-containing protein [Candidatus Tenebribacter burtonii]
MNKVYCPLEYFCITYELSKYFKKSKEFIINSNLKIITKNNIPDFSKWISYFLSSDEIENKTDYWIRVSANCSFKELSLHINLFQLSLLIIKPSKTKIPYKYNGNNFHRYEYKFNFIQNFTKEITKKDILNIAEIYPAFLKIYQESKRLRSAIVYMLNGCITITWNSAYILYMTTFETLLSDGSERGIKKKLAWAYAILTETDNEKRQKAFDEFRDIYKIRSEILHGKSFKDKFGKGEINLEKLANCRDMLRKLWQVILASKETKEKLSGNDSVRRKYFKKVSNGWMPEGLNKKKRCEILYKTFSFLKKLIGCNYS